MALESGSTLGPYQVLGPLGAGGMGEVYRARDPKLSREVAIKVLPAEVARDPERLSRFQREATLLAALNHPHIAAIYGLEESDGSPFLVLELVEGEDLAERLKRGPIPVADTLEIARQIAEALEDAHEKGIVHRDLKPANVKLTRDGKVKVLDFGLAKAYAGDAGPDSQASDFTQSPTLAQSGTAAGVILGTAAYMSPEQARGRPVDKRADIWAFGVVLFEMLTGERLFRGETVSDTLASILKEEPDWTRLPTDTPRKLSDLLRHSLRKAVRDRLRDIGDARIQIEDAIAGGGDEASAGSPASPRAAWTRVAAFTVGALAVGLLLGVAVATRDPSPAPSREVTRLTLDLPEGWVLRSGDGHLGRSARQAMALSPDGRHLVYAATDGERAQLFLRPLDRQQAVPIPGTEGDLEMDAPSSPFFSPDGQSIGFFAGVRAGIGFRESGQLRRVPLSGGEVRTVSVSGADFHRRWASWAEDDTILLVAQEGLMRVPAQGGTTAQLTTVDRSRGESLHLFPEMLPGAEAVLFNVARGQIPSAWNIVAQSIDTGQRRVLVEGGSDPRYVASGHIVFARGGTLMAVPFDVSRLQVTGDPVVVIEDVMHTERGSGTDTTRGDVQLAVSRAGACAYVPGGVYPVLEFSLGWVDHEGNAEILPLPPGRMRRPRVSPDGTRLVYTQGPNGETQVWVYDIGLEVPTRLTSRGDNRSPVWSPDGTRVVFTSDGGDGSPFGLFWLAADGRGQPERLTEALRYQAASSWSRDGVLAFVDVGASFDIMTLPMEEDGEPAPFLQTRFNEQHPAFSPDGRWLAYSSDATGRWEVYVRPFPAGEPEHRISTEGGTAPLWSRDGRQLFYKASGRPQEWTFMVVDVTAGETFDRSSQPRPLFSGRYGPSWPTRGYDISPDGQRFVMPIRPADSPEPLRMTSIDVVLNWHEELRRLAPAN